MRRKKKWTDAEVEKLRSMVGKHSQDQIAQELGRPRGSVATKAHELNLSLVFHRLRQKPASMDPGPVGMGRRWDGTFWLVSLLSAWRATALRYRRKTGRLGRGGPRDVAIADHAQGNI
jgi:hypothetical protein